MQQWEYMVTRACVDLRQVNEHLDEYGRDGWELVSVSDGMAYSKRATK